MESLTNFVNPVNSIRSIKRPRSKLMWVILLGVGILVLSIVGGVIGTRVTRDTDCECRRPSDAGWMGFSITYFILSIVGIILSLKFGLLCADKLKGLKNTNFISY